MYKIKKYSQECFDFGIISAAVNEEGGQCCSLFSQKKCFIMSVYINLENYSNYFSNLELLSTLLIRAALNESVEINTMTE